MATTQSAADTHALQQLDDRAKVTDLVYRLGVYLDEGRFEEMHELLVENATVRTPGGQAEGRDSVISQAQRNHRPSQRFQHVTTNVLVDLDGDRAKVRANLVVHIAIPGDAPAGAPATQQQCAVGEVYNFEVVRTTDGWRFVRIATFPLCMSGALPPNPPEA